MNNQMNNLLEDQYATKDLYFAAFLEIKGLSIVKLEKYGSANRRGNSPVYFIFDNREECERLEDAFWSGDSDDAFCNIRDFTNAVRNLRSRAFSVDRTLNQTEKGLNKDY